MAHDVGSLPAPPPPPPRAEHETRPTLEAEDGVLSSNHQRSRGRALRCIRPHSAPRVHAMPRTPRIHAMPRAHCSWHEAVLPHRWWPSAPCRLPGLQQLSLAPGSRIEMRAGAGGRLSYGAVMEQLHTGEVCS